ncbi:hypothetical protein WN943_029273 [Citrus x changshan-huyou]
MSRRLSAHNQFVPIRHLDSTAPIRSRWRSSRVQSLAEEWFNAEEIKKKYKETTMMVHPDKCPSVAATAATKLSE